jgi:hypothetical protein
VVVFVKKILLWYRMSTPRDPELYEKTKRRVQKQFGRWSAYASGALVQQYKAAFQKKHGHDRAYIGTKKKSAPLTTWFRENWIDVKTGRACGNAKTTDYYPTCRPKREYDRMTTMQRRKMIAKKQKSGSKTTSYRDIL